MAAFNPGGFEVYARGTRVEVELDGVTTDSARWGSAKGVIVDIHLVEGDDDPSYLIEFEIAKPLPVEPRTSPEETQTRRWSAWEFVRKLSLLELLAEAAL